MQIYKHINFQTCKYAIMQIYKCANVQIANVQMCKYANSIHILSFPARPLACLSNANRHENSMVMEDPELPGKIHMQERG